MRLILASTSPYRRELLNRFRLPFEQIDPEFKEAKPGSMPPEALVKYNALGKAKNMLAMHPDAPGCTRMHPDATVIASDQIAVCRNIILGKPGSIKNACQQLRLTSGQTVTFLTGLTILSAQSEGLGISLFERMAGDDPTALIGLPLIRLSQWLHPLMLMAGKRHL